MKILYLIDFGFDMATGSNHLVLRAIQDFLKAGHEVHLVESHSLGKYANIPDSLLEFPKFTYDVVNRQIVAKGNFAKRYLHGIKFELDAYKKWKKHIKDCDMVVHQSHYTSPFTSILLGKYKGKVVFNLYDIFPGEAYTNGNIRSKFVYDVLAWLEKIVYKKSAKIFTLTEDTKKTLISLGVPDEKITIVPNWFDDTRISRVDISNNSFTHEFNMDPNKKYIQYAGSIGVSYDFDLLLNTAKLLEDRKDIVFQVVGEGLFLDHMKERVKNESMTNVEFVPWQPADKLSEVYSSCTLQIIPLRKDVICNSYPSKILPLMACERVPIISVNKDSYFYEDINSRKVGIAVPIGDKDGLAESVLRLSDNEELRRQYEKNAYKYVCEKFSATTNTNKMLKEFENLIKNNRR